MRIRPEILESMPISNEQQLLRSEWRNLCFTLERLQADALLASNVDKYRFARTYAVYGQNFEALSEGLLARAELGDYEFFVDRGMHEALMSPTLAERMLSDWQGAIASKKSRLADAFSCRYGEEIEEFLVLPRYAAKLNLASALDEGDALLLMPTVYRR